MADILSLDWGERRIRGVVARVSGDAVHATAAFDEAWTDEAPTSSPAAAGAWLAERVRACGYTGREVRVCLPRTSVIVRRLDLPAVPAEELPPMVEMQTATRSASGLEGLALDFVPVEVSEKGCSVLAGTTSRKLLDNITRICEAAGLRVQWVGLDMVAAAELVVRATQRATDEMALVVSVHDQALEATLVRGHRVLFTQSSEIHGVSDDEIGRAVSADIRRSLVAHGNGLSAAALDHIWWLGHAEATAPQRAIVSDRLKVTVEPFDPLANDIVRSDGITLDGAVVAGALGALLEGARVEQFNFLDPRKPPKKVDVKRQRMIIGASVAAVLLVGTLIWRQVRLSTLASRIDTLSTQKSDADRYVEDRTKVIADAADVKKWEALRRDWLEDVAALEREFPDRDRALLSELRLSVGSRNPLGTVAGRGRAKSREEVEEFYNRLDANGYTVPAREIPRGGGGAEYEVRFDLDATFPDPAVEAARAAKKKSTEQPAKKETAT